jgi:voltage-gated potassium channel
MGIKKRVFEIIEKTENGEDKAGLAFDYMILSLIIVNVIAIVAGSHKPFEARFYRPLYIRELVSVIIFSIEYVLRFWTAKLKFPDAKHPYIKHSFSFMAIVDLLAILPFFLPLILTVDLRYLRIMRLFRILRILKLNRYNNSLNLMAQVLKNEKEKLVMTLFIMFMLLLLAASSMYYIESYVQPENFPDIITTLWCAVATVTTIGYGDVYPVTAIGRTLAGIIAILGIGIIALPTGIISSGFVNEVGRGKNICPHCNKEIE